MLALFPPFVFCLSQVLLQLFKTLFGKLCLKSSVTFGSFIEEAGSFDNAIVAELLGKVLSIRPFWSFLQEVIEEAKDFHVQIFKGPVLVVAQLLRDGVVIALQKVCTLLIAGLFIL